jgi:hypothetical protein
MTRPGHDIAISLFVAVVLAGCGTSPEPRFYTLSAGGISASDKTDKGEAEYTVAVGPITLPEMVDRPQLVVRVGVNQVELLDQHRWAEPLKSEIPRVVAENLAHLLGAKQVVTYPHNASFTAEYRVLLDIQHFDSAPGQAVTIDTLWTIRATSGGEPKTGRSVAREPTNGNDYDALVAAHGRALATVSREIAESIRAAGPTPAGPTSPASTPLGSTPP